MKFCQNCGVKLEDDADYCPNCGNHIKANDVDGESQNTISNNGFKFDKVLNNSKLIILAIVIVIALVGVFSLMGVLFSNDIVDVTSIEMSVGYSDTPFGGAVESSIAAKIDEAQELLYLKEHNPNQYKLEMDMGGMSEAEMYKYANYTMKDHTAYQAVVSVVKFSLMPRETINRVTGISLKNIEVSFDGGGSENWGSFKFDPKTSYLKDNNYKFSITKTLEDKSIEEYYKINHIKADIVINTTDEKNKVVGHINQDITPKS